MKTPCCRFCQSTDLYLAIDLGMTPLSNAYVSKEKAHLRESFYPLQAFVCKKCFLVQVDELESPEEIFSNYAYFSSYSKSWLEHSKKYAHQMIERFDLTPQKNVV